ncbi:protein decapentaplegic-like [Oculina patagonica]
MLKRFLLFSAAGDLAGARELQYLGSENQRFHNIAEGTALLKVPSFVADLYRSFAKDNGTVKKKSKWIPATVHCLEGQATPGNNGIFYKLNVSDILTNESILSAKVRVMVKIPGRPQSPLPASGNLVLYDQLDQRPVQSVRIKGGGARLVVFPVLDLVKRWINYPHLNHGVYIKLLSNRLEDGDSLLVMIDSTGEARDNRPLLVVETQSKPQKVDTLPFWKSHGQRTDRKPKSRHSRAIRDQGPCSRRPMRVEFGENIRWKGIVVPTFYDAYRCGGDCKFPLDNKVNPTQRAILQAILYSAGLDQGSGEPCCVPIKLRGISVIEQHDNDYSMKFHKEMAVEECGCR